MTTLVTFVLSGAEKIPIVGSPINHATTWYRKRSCSQESDLETPPPPYEKEHSRLTQISDYVWKKASFSASSSNNSVLVEPSTETPASPALNKEHVTEGISLIQMASEMSNMANGKNQQFSIDLFMMGLDKILTSLPIDSDPATKLSLQKKLSEFKERSGLVLQEAPEKKTLSNQERKEALGGLSDLIIQAAVVSAVALRKSPLPGIVSKFLDLTKYSLMKIDEKCSIRERTSNITHAGIAKAIEMDQHYEVHQFFAEVFYTGCTAVLKAGIAFANYEPKEQQHEIVVPPTA